MTLLAEGVDVKKAQEGATSRASTESKTHRHNTKKEAILKTFTELGTRGMNCFEAANKYHDYVLRTTVSEIHRDHGIEFNRQREQVPNAFGKLTSCARYWLDDGNINKALAVLGSDKKQGGML